MHTAICTFEERADAERAVERLLQSGFDRADVHLEVRHPDGTPMLPGERGGGRDGGHLMHGQPAAPGQANDNWDGIEREVAMDPSLLHRLGHFFDRLFGRDEGTDSAGSGHARAYRGAVERGLCVVFVDAHSEDEAERAQDLLHGMEARDLNLVHRAGHPRLRDVVAERQDSDLGQQFGTARAGMGASHNRDTRREGELFPPERGDASQGHDAAEPAMASMGWGEQRRLDVVEDDKPIASPDLHPRQDKPR